ncbi:hypothetical protein Srufu_011920 [Streptomyces libani subsp. rufus]|nr:hypothetical protein Srufu_011920 [Streptomyces libani subsp. rufus]
MRRVRFHSYGGPDVLRVEEAAAPVPGPGELLVRTEAIGVTLPCVRRVRGDGNGGGDPLPATPGGEIAGTVVALGPDVTGFAPATASPHSPSPARTPNSPSPPPFWRAGYRTGRAPWKRWRWCAAGMSRSPRSAPPHHRAPSPY